MQMLGAPLGFFFVMAVIAIRQKLPEWERQYRWWRLPQSEKDRIIADYTRLVCRPSFVPVIFRQLSK